MNKNEFYTQIQYICHPDDYKENVEIVTRIKQEQQQLFLALLKYGADIKKAKKCLEIVQNMERNTTIHAGQVIDGLFYFKQILLVIEHIQD